MTSKTMTIGDVSARPGEIKYGPAMWVELRGGTRTPLPVIVINGKEEGPRLVLNGATHPTELSGTATVHALRRKIDPAKLRGSIVAFPIANPLAMQFGHYVSPHDGANLAVSYPGSKTGSITSRIANFIWTEATLGASLVIDLHENVSPCLMFTLTGFCNDKKVEKRTMELAHAYGLTAIRTPPVDMGTPGTKVGDLYWAELAMANGIPGFTAELEGSFESRFDEKQPVVRIGVRGIMNTLKELGMIDGDVEPQTDTLVIKGDFAANGSIRVNKAGLVNRFVEPGKYLRKGTKVAEVLDPYGDVVETLTMPVDGYIWAWTIIGPENPNWCVQEGSTAAFVFSKM